MRKKLTLILLSTLLVTLLASCASIPHEANPSDSKLKSIVICESWDINTGFTPVFDVYSGWGSFYYLGNFYETLVKYENGKIVPGLAESWQVNGGELTFKLREGIKFTDDTEFNAEVVKKNLEMIPKIMVEEYVNSITLLTKIEDIKVIDQYTVMIKLKEPYYAALQELAGVRPMGMMSLNAFTEQGLSEEVFAKTFGTGKYMIENAVKGTDYTFVRNDNYWGDKPKIEQFTVKTIPNMDAKIMALRSGEIDLIFGANNITYDTLKEFSNDERYLTKTSQFRVKTRTIIINSTKAPFNELAVRQAVQYAIDKQLICDSLFLAVEDKADYLFNPDLPFCRLVSEPYNYDPEKAKQLLAKAGWTVNTDNIREKNGQLLETDILYDSSTGIQGDLALTLASQLEKVGFKVNLTGLDHMASSTKFLSGDSTMFLTKTYGIPYEPHTDINNMQAGAWYYQSQLGIEQKQELDQKVKELLSLVEEEQVQEAYNYILGTLHDEAVYLPISYLKELVILDRQKIKDYIFNGQPLNIDISGVVPN